MKKLLSLLLAAVIALSCLAGCSPQAGQNEGQQMHLFTDSCGREVEVPVDITKIACSGSTAQMILFTLAPEKLVGISSTPSESQMVYLPDCVGELPQLGNFYGSKADMNLEALAACGPEIIIDLGDMKEGHAEDMDMVQEQTGIPTVFIRTEIENLAEGYRSLGKLIGREEKAEKIALFIEKTLTMAEENSAKIAEADKKSVMYATMQGLSAIAQGSIQDVVMGLVGVNNAVIVDDITNKGLGNELSLEQIYVFDPEIIIAVPSAYEAIISGEEFAELSALKNGKVYEIPEKPYCWMSNPPSVNMIIGIWWLGNLVYPEVYDYDMAEISREFYSLFFDYELSEEEAEAFLENSLGKVK